MNLLHTILESPAAQRLGWTLLHFLWQGAAVALVLRISLIALRQRGAATRYFMSCAALLVLAAMPIMTFAWLGAERQTVAADVTPKPIAVAPTKTAPTALLMKTTTAAANPAMPLANPTTPARVPSPTLAVTAPSAPPATVMPAFSQRLFRLLPPALPWLVLGWCVGVFALSIWHLGGWIATRRLRWLLTAPAPQQAVDAAARLAHRMGLRRAVRLVQSSLIDSPMVIGAICPVILLPASLLTGLAPAQLESLLAHELAHLRRHDYLVNLVQCLIETLLFYHPAVWWVSRQIRIEREHCCDDHVVALTRDRSSYVRALAAVAQSRASTAATFAVAASGTRSGGGGALLPRIRRLIATPADADAVRSPRWLAGAMALAIGLLATGAIVTRAADPANKGPTANNANDPDFDLPKTWILDLEIVDKASGEAFPKLPLAVRADNRPFAFSTDDRGHAAVQYPDAAKNLAITIKPDGYVPTTLTWRNVTPKDPIPGTFKLEMERGTTIGGIIQDEAGKPVKDATVTLLIHRKDEGAESRITTPIWDYPVKTDDQGRWRCDIAPAQLDDPWIRLSHPDYLSDEMYGATPKPPLEKLRDMTGVMVLKKGVAVAGRVLDTDGLPIAGATVAQGRDRFGTHFPTAKTDADGKFRFAQARAGSEMVLTVTAKGRAPDQKTFQVDRDVTDLEFKLEPGHIVRGRVVDPDGKPLAGVMIATDTWRSNRALMFRTNTDADGRFIWNEAPDDEVLTDVLLKGYMDDRHVPLKASDQEQTITLRRPLHVSGTVVDADSGQPVENFKLLQGTYFGNPQQPIYWDRREADAKPHEGGKFDFDVTFPRPGYAARVEADGYLPADSRVFHDSEATVALEFKLKRGKSLAGVIRAPDGKPLAGADVVLCLPPNGLYIIGGQLQQRHDHAVVVSDDAGNYKLPPQTGAYSLVVLHDSGYAQATSEQLAKSADVTVEPWGKVTGVLRAGATPKAGAMMTVSHIDGAPAADPAAPRVYHDLQAMTDKDGRFTFNRVPAGPASVSLQVKLNERMTSYSNTQQIEVTPGKTTEVNIGGQGRPIVGRVNVPPDLAAKIDWPAGQSSFFTKIASPPLPAGWQTMEPAAREKWMTQFKQSPEGRAYEQQLAARRSFTMKVGSDGKFRTDDVPAGVYQVIVVLNGVSHNELRMGGQALATATTQFTVPEIPGGRSDEPLDIGVIETKPVQPIAPAAPK